MANRYWVGGSGTWDVSDTTHWSATSGGAGGQSVPTTTDDVFINGSSGGGTVTVTATANAKSVNFTGFAGTFAGSSQINVAGNFTFSTGMTQNWVGVLSTTGAVTSTITPNGKSITELSCNANITELGGNLVLIATTGSVFAIATGKTFNTNNYNITSNSFPNLQGTQTVHLGSSLIIISGTGGINMNGFSGTFDAGTSTIKFTNTANDTCDLIVENQTFYNVWFDRGTSNGIITMQNTASNTFHGIKDTGTVAHTMRFRSGTTTTLTSATGWEVSGHAGALITILSSYDVNSNHTIRCTSGTISADYLSINHSTANGGANFYAGANSTDGGSNSGWNFTAPPIGPANLKSYNTNLKANIKSINTNLIANVKSLNTNV